MLKLHGGRSETYENLAYSSSSSIAGGVISKSRRTITKQTSNQVSISIITLKPALTVAPHSAVGIRQPVDERTTEPADDEPDTAQEPQRDGHETATVPVIEYPLPEPANGIAW